MNGELVCEHWDMQKHKHRCLSQCAWLSSAPTNKHPSNMFSLLPILVVLNCQCAMFCGVCGTDTLKAYLSCDVDELEWGLGICILNKHSMNWMVGPWAILWKTLMCLQYMIKHWLLSVTSRWSFKGKKHLNNSTTSGILNRPVGNSIILLKVAS